MLDAVDVLESRLPLGDTSLSLASASLRPMVDTALAARSRTVHVEQDLWKVLTSTDIVLAATGGNLLDAVFADAPAVAAYRVDAATYWIARHLMRLDKRVAACALPNLIAGERLVPELIQREVTAGRLAEAATTLLTDETARESMYRGYRKLRQALGRPGVNQRIAATLLSALGVRPAALPV
jgi:lipid-A-disaccharide synthase